MSDQSNTGGNDPADAPSVASSAPDGDFASVNDSNEGDNPSSSDDNNASDVDTEASESDPDEG